MAMKMAMKTKICRYTNGFSVFYNGFDSPRLHQNYATAECLFCGGFLSDYSAFS